MARVLVVDDDVGTREMFEHILRVEGHAVNLAATGLDGLRLAQTLPLDLLLVDVRLPDIDGLSLFEHLRVDGVEIPCILMTGFASTAIAFEAGRLGVAAYLEKPITAEELLHVVRVHAQGREASSSNVDRFARSSAHTPRVLRLIEHHYNDPVFDIHSLVAACGITREHLARVLHEDTGRTFTELLRARRMKEARRLLADTALRIKEIYQQVGFTSASEFDHAFKQRWGISPRTYRLSWWRGRTGATSPPDDEEPS